MGNKERSRTSCGGPRQQVLPQLPFGILLRREPYGMLRERRRLRADTVTGLKREAEGSRDAAALATGRSMSDASTIRRIPIKGPADPNEAEERRRKGREYLARRNQQMLELQQRRKAAAKAEGVILCTTGSHYKHFISSALIKIKVFYLLPFSLRGVHNIGGRSVEKIDEDCNLLGTDSEATRDRAQLRSSDPEARCAGQQ